MKLVSAILSAASFACALLSSHVVAAQDKPLPWDGRGQDLTVDTLSSKYLLHILTQRKNGTSGDPADYVSINQHGRSPAYNRDTGVISIGVDNDAVFKTQTNFRRSELVQNVAGAPADATAFFRASVKQDTPFVNKYAWQIVFPESHIFELRVDATQQPPMLMYLNNGTWDAKWSTAFKPKTWYNFGIGVSKGAASGSTLTLYTSEGDQPLKLAATHNVVTAFPSSYEFHYGLLTLSNDGSDPVMVHGKQDVLDFNGVSVEQRASPEASDAAATPKPLCTKAN